MVCKFNDCNEIHSIKNLTDLPVNVLAENALRDNRRTITDFLLNKLQSTITDLKGMCVYMPFINP